ncbi:MAG TPA: cysteine dioxygenase [Kiloniellales bacterium]|nr:cysteine dioxygenase [Kiloniellales bacterium]
MSETNVDVRPLRDFVVNFTRLIEAAPTEAVILEKGRTLLARLIARDDWLAEDFTRPHPEHYRQYLLHCDPLERFSVVSFVWGPGQKTPVHNHTVWGLIGVLRGSEAAIRFRRGTTGRLEQAGEREVLRQGAIDAVSPTIGDIHEVSNNEPEQTSVSIHVYGANIGAVGREVYDLASGQSKPFVSGYSSTSVPNLWDRSAEERLDQN